MDKSLNRQSYSSPSESESMACNESVGVNVGGPIRSRMDVSIDRQV
jgi:hypothetical protein